ncbi:MAG: cob(I)yrinic acid a,c-diamide adenosyltransferase [Chloroflexota bacterium]
MKAATRGLTIVNTGNGKGKTTAALGLMMRAWGHGKKVVMLQFIKKATANYGEHRAARRMGIELVAGGAGFVRSAGDVDKSRQMAVEQWRLAGEKIGSGAYDLVVLDELSYPLRFGWISATEVLHTLSSRPPTVHVVITGRDMPGEIVEMADLVTEMKEVKHPLGKGIKAQPGIEF